MRKRPGQVGIMVRLPEDLRDRVAAAAAEDRRSMNSEIQALLDVALEIRERQRARRAQQLDEIAEELR